MNNNVEQKLQALFDDYAKKLPQKLQYLQSQWQTLRKNWSAANLEDFHREIHSLSGSSATYGYTSLAQGTKQLDIYLRVLIKSGSALTEETDKEITFLLNNLEPKLDLFSREKSSLSAITQPKLQQEKLIYIVDSTFQKEGNVWKNLKNSGYIVESLATVKDLKQHLDKQQPIAIIVDVEHVTDEQAGYLTELKKHNEIPVPYVCISSNGNLAMRLKAIRLGGAAFFEKPLDPFLLSRMFDQLYESITSQSYRILIVDDSASLAEYHALILQEAGMVTKILTDPMVLMQAVFDFQPDLLLMDIYMPKCTGLELAAVLRQQPLYTSLPIIFLSREDDRFKQLSAMMIGGDDFLMKPILPQHLVASVKSRAKRAGILSSFMIRDSLTELLNHTKLLQELELALRRAERDVTPLSFVILDIDYFKTINDTYGHQMGDYVLRKLSEILLSQLRKTDLVGRYGGDEFAFILPSTDRELSIKLCERIREVFAALEFKSHGNQFLVTFSMGIASFPPLNHADTIIAAADQALYRAKELGRNQVVHTDPR